jgi:hypothetical protein
MKMDSYLLSGIEVYQIVIFDNQSAEGGVHFIAYKLVKSALKKIASINPPLLCPL